MNEKLIERLYLCEKIEALVLGGSRATGKNDDNSDFDYYVYLSEDLSENERQLMLKDFVKYMEYSNEFWELEDDGILKNGIDIEFIYRTISDMSKSLDNLLIKGNVSNGFSTCFVDNLIASKVIFDKKGNYKELQDRYKKLLTNDFYDLIVYKNFPILMDRMPSLYFQVEKALKRNDLLSMNHRSSAYFEMYFDIIFAINRQTHPGEKRMLELASELSYSPKDMKKDITEYFNFLFVNHSRALELLEKISIDLFDLLVEKGYHVTINSYKK